MYFVELVRVSWVLLTEICVGHFLRQSNDAWKLGRQLNAEESLRWW